MNELALFAGAGGGILGGHLLGWRTICAVEWELYPASVLISRQNDGILPPFPVWDDVQTFDGKQWRGRVDVISGGFPCQDISIAGKGAGIDGERSSMWKHMARIIGEVQPRFVLVENSPMLVGRGLTRVLSDLAEMGYDAEWGIVGAHHAEAPHRRDRIWLVGYSDNYGLTSSKIAGSIAQGGDDCAGGQEQTQQPAGSSEQYAHLADTESGRRGKCGDSDQTQGCSCSGKTQPSCSSSDVPDSNSKRGCSRKARSKDAEDAGQSSRCEGGLRWWDVEPNVGRVAHGVAARVDRLKAIGNGQVPAVAKLAWEVLSNEWMD